MLDSVGNGTMFSYVMQYRNKDYCTEYPVVALKAAQGLKLYTAFW